MRKEKIISPEKIIVSHRNPDFDSFSCSFAAKKIFPDYTIVISGEGSQNLQEFFAIYSEMFEFYQEEEVNFSNVREVIVVDTSTVERLGFEIQRLFSEKKLKIRVYDHHPGISKVLFPEHEILEGIVEEIGSATTILVKKLKEKNIILDSKEASLLAIGIYEDTGNFLFSSTSTDDMDAGSYLLQNNANLDVVSAFVKIDMTIDQKNVMEELSSNVIKKKIKDVEIYIGISETEKFIGGLNLIVSKIWLSEGYDTYLAVVRMGKKVYVVGRTASEDVNLGQMMGSLKGGGHKKAAACKFLDSTVQEALDKITSSLENFVSPALRVKDIMSTPVKTILSGIEIKEAAKILEITGFGGIPVIEDNKLAGMVVRRDITKAINHNLGEKPVKSIMSTNIYYVRADDSAEKAKQMMVENGIGRIPVLKSGMLVGIITRTDVIRAVYREKERLSFIENPLISKYDVKSLFIRNIEPDIYKVLERVGRFADSKETRIYLVGGFVRDLLLGYKNLDIDIVVEGNAIEFARLLSEAENCKIEEHQKFMTARVFFNGGLEIDFATARIEYYEYPGALPMVEFASIKKDLYRRDFSINAMAVSLNDRDLGLSMQGPFGELLDFFGCRRDLENKVIRVLYNTSFVDDPTRILRGIRYEQRYGFETDGRTLELLKENLEGKYLEKISGGRIRYELIRCLEEKNVVNILKRLGKLDILKHIFPNTYYTAVLEKKIERLFRFLPWVEKFFSGKTSFNRFYTLLFVLLEYYTMEGLKSLEERYGIPKKFLHEIYSFSKRVELSAKLISEEMKFSEIFLLLEGLTPEGTAYLGSYLDDEGMEYLKEYLRVKKSIKMHYLSGNLLIKKYKINDGGEIKRIMNEIMKKKLDGEITGLESEKEFLENELLLEGGKDGVKRYSQD